MILASTFQDNISHSLTKHVLIRKHNVRKMLILMKIIKYNFQVKKTNFKNQHKRLLNHHTNKSWIRYILTKIIY